MSVAEFWLPPPPPSSYEIVDAVDEGKSPGDLQKDHYRDTPAVQAAEAIAQRAKERLKKNFPEWELQAEASWGSPAWELIMKADKWEPDLIVVGSQGHSALGRFVLGSVSQKVVTEARSSVRVARRHDEVDEHPVRILIGVDGSPGSAQAVRAAATRNWPAGSEALIITVDDPVTPSVIGSLLPPIRKWVEDSNAADREWTQKMADRAANELRKAGLAVSSVVVEGDPKKVLIEEAKRRRADSIFVGSTGFSNRFERFLLGSVSAAVAARAHCSVEVVRAMQS
jgi:nucleotide-binding universal stress UspA family protein